MSSRLGRAILREDLYWFFVRCFSTLNPGTPYLENWYMKYLAFRLMMATQTEGMRLIINLPPRYGKSQFVTAYVAWLMGHNPALKVMVISYSERLTRQHARDFRAIVDSPWYRDLFPAYKIKRATDLEVETTLRGYRLASSMNGTILGRGADLIVIDDPMKAQGALSKVQRDRVNEIYDHTIYSRLNDKNKGSILIVGHRLHQDDLVGHVMAKDDWDQVIVPAVETENRVYVLGPLPFQVYRRRAGALLHPEREGRAEIEVARRTLGAAGFAAQYQQDPIPDTGNIIQRSWIRYYDAQPEEVDLVVVSWDTASTLEPTSDFSVGTVWALHRTDIYLFDVVRGRWGLPDLLRQIEALSLRYDAEATLIEMTDTGRGLVQGMRLSSAIRPILQRPVGEKAVRMAVQSPKFEAGQVVLPKDAPWLADYLSELLAFPNGRHDDQVDSTSQALAWLSRKIAMRTPPRRASPRRRDPVRR